MLPAHVLEKLEALPVQSGVYLFKDKKGTVVYVGKAKSLRSRVRSYFQAGGSDERYFIPILQRTVGDLETIVTANEKEAAILENTLIKQYDPRYNVKLRDDKDFLCIRLDTTHEWPRLSVLRRRSVNNADGKGGGRARVCRTGAWSASTVTGESTRRSATPRGFQVRDVRARRML